MKTGIRVHGLEEADMIWKTCLALHNRLLEIDGLDEQWNSGVPSRWQGEDGQHDATDPVTVRAIGRLHNPSAIRDYDTSAMGPGNDRRMTEE